jgi:hypothetical protein
METRALAIAFFYAVGTAAGGIAGPLLFGNLIASGSRLEVAVGFFIGAGVMLIGGIAEIFFGVPAEQTRLEDVAEPLSAVGTEQPSRGTSRGGRFRPGPGYTSASSPWIGSGTPERRSSLARQRQAIVSLLVERGPTRREDIYRAVGASRWGPGTFREALHQAVADGSVRRARKGIYAAREERAERAS